MDQSLIDLDSSIHVSSSDEEEEEKEEEIVIPSLNERLRAKKLSAIGSDNTKNQLTQLRLHSMTKTVRSSKVIKRQKPTVRDSEQSVTKQANLSHAPRTKQSSMSAAVSPTKRNTCTEDIRRYCSPKKLAMNSDEEMTNSNNHCIILTDSSDDELATTAERPLLERMNPKSHHIMHTPYELHTTTTAQQRNSSPRACHVTAVSATGEGTQCDPIIL